MRYAEIAGLNPLRPEPTRHAVLDAVRAAHAERIRPEVAWPSPAGRAALRYAVECHGLTVHGMGEAFAGEFHGRRRW